MPKQRKPENERFVVAAVWDDEAGVYISKSNIIGLHIEAETLAEFEAIVDECVAEFILENHKPRNSALKRALVEHEARCV